MFPGVARVHKGDAYVLVNVEGETASGGAGGPPARARALKAPGVVRQPPACRRTPALAAVGFFPCLPSSRLSDASRPPRRIQIHRFTRRHALGVTCERLCRRPHGQRSAPRHPRPPWSPDTLIRNGMPMGDLATCSFFSPLFFFSRGSSRQLTRDLSSSSTARGSQPVGQCFRRAPSHDSDDAHARA
jgi:hypothetical protein